MQSNSIIVDDDNIRIDKYIRKAVPGITQALIEKFLRKGMILLDNARVKSDVRVNSGQVISIKNKDKIILKEIHSTQRKYDLEFVKLIKANILYENQDILAINKPAGVSVQGGSKVKISIDDILDQIKPGEHFKIVHRLDKNTSGVLLLARNRKIAQLIMEEFKERRVKKKYLALTNGIPKSDAGEINYPLAKKYISGEEKMVVDESIQKDAITLFSILKKFPNTNTALLELQPLTGRKHQIRVHLSHIKCPTLGDKKYGVLSKTLINSHLQLHAHSLSIQLLDDNPTTIIAPIPDYMTKAIKFLENS